MNTEEQEDGDEERKRRGHTKKKQPRVRANEQEHR